MLRLSYALSILSVAAVSAPSVLAQDDSAAKPAVVRKQPQELGTQEKINAVFGDLIGMVTYYPFWNIAPWFGLSTAPQLLRDEQGEPKVAAKTLEGHTGAVQRAVFAPDGNTVLTIGADHTARLFDLRGKELANQPHPAAIAAAAFYPGGGEFATACADGKVRVFEAGAGAGNDETYRGTLTIDAHTGAASRVWYSPDGIWLASYGADGAVRIFDAKGEKAAEFTDINGGVRDVLITSDVEKSEELVLIVDGAGALHIHRANGIAIKKIDDLDVQSLTFAPGESHVLAKLGPVKYQILTVAGETTGTIDLSPDTKALRATMTDAGDGLQIVILDDKGTKHWYDAAGNAIKTEDNAGSRGDGFFLETDERSPNSVTVKTYGEDTAWVLAGHSDRVLGSAIAPDGTRAITVSADGTAKVWEWFVRGPDGNTVSTNIPFVVLWLVIAAVLFTVYMKFVNFRMFGHAVQVVRGKFSNPEDTGEVSHFQALSSALSATVGLGNIAGVAIAVSVGGPGATFWMIVAGLLGMTLKFTECTLGQKFRKIDDEGRVSGGPMHYLKEGLQQKGLGIIGVPLAIVFTVFCIGGSLAGGNAFQVNQSGNILQGQVPFFADYPWVYGVGLAFFVGIVIIGGIKRIAQTAEKIVPTMCGLYVLAALTILVMNFDAVPAAFGTIVSSALSGDAIYGGALGSLIMGFRRAAFSNEAGVGSASIAHSAARTPYAVREGIVALLEPFIDTVVVCTMTALVIVITGVYNAEQFPEYVGMVAGNNGAGLTAKAFGLNPILAGWFPWVLMVAVILFAFSTMISWSYYGERCWTNLFGQKSSLSFKLLFLAFTVLGSVVTATNVLEFGDVMILLMAFPNIFGLYFLGGLVKADLAEYEEKMRNGELEVYK